MTLLLVCGAYGSSMAKFVKELTSVHKVIHQTTYLKPFSELPKRELGESVAVPFWDVRDSVDWHALMLAMNAALVDCPAGKVVVVEGSMVVYIGGLCIRADSILFFGVSRETCFSRRREDEVRDWHLAYQRHMWDEHCWLMSEYEELHEEHFAKTFWLSEQETLSGSANDASELVARPLDAIRARMPLYDPAEQKKQFFKLLKDTTPSWWISESDVESLFLAAESSGPERKPTLLAIFLFHGLGDAAGAPYEFPVGRCRVEFHNFCLFDWVVKTKNGALGAPAGCVTDDNQILHILARCIVDCGGQFVRDAFVLAYMRWLQKGPSHVDRHTKKLLGCSPAKSDADLLAHYNKVYAERESSIVLGNDNWTLAGAPALLLMPNRSAALDAVRDTVLISDSAHSRAASRLYVALLWDLCDESSVGYGKVKLSTWVSDSYLRTFCEGSTSVYEMAKAALFGTRTDNELYAINVGGGTMYNSALIALWVALRTCETARPLFDGNDDDDDRWIVDEIADVIRRGGAISTNAAVTAALLSAAAGWRFTVNDTSAYYLGKVLGAPYRFSSFKNFGRPCDSALLLDRFFSLQPPPPPTLPAPPSPEKRVRVDEPEETDGKKVKKEE